MEVNLANEQLVEFDYFVPIEDDNMITVMVQQETLK